MAFSMFKFTPGSSAAGTSHIYNEQKDDISLGLSEFIDIPDEHGRTPIQIAARKRVDVVKWLFKAGADINHVDDDGYTLLMHAVHAKDRGATVRWILEQKDYEHSIDAITKRAKETALFIAADNHSPEATRLLLEAKANPYQRNREGIYPVQAAVLTPANTLTGKREQFEVVKSFIVFGYNDQRMRDILSIKVNGGRSLAEVAFSQGNLRLAELLTRPAQANTINFDINTQHYQSYSFSALPTNRP